MEKIKGYFSFSDQINLPYDEKSSSIGERNIGSKKTTYFDNNCFISTSCEANEKDSEFFSINDDRYIILINGPLTFDKRFMDDKMSRLGRKEKFSYVIDHFDHIGPAIFNTFDGSFFVSIYDKVRKRLILITDRLNSRLFFFSQQQSGFYFSNDIRSLLSNQEIKQDLDYQSLFEFIRFSMILEDRTLYSEIKTFEQGLMIQITKDRVSRNNYWTSAFDESWNMSNQDYLEKLKGSIFRANLELMTENNLGLLLSGGLDSRIIAASALSAGKDIRGITFGGFQNEEVKLAKRVADVCGFEFNFIKRSPDYYSDNFEKAIGQSQGLFSFIHAHMIGLSNPIQNLGIDTIISGCGMGIYFSGQFFPKIKISHLPGRYFYLIWPKRLNEDDVYVNTYGFFNSISDRFLSKIIRDRYKDVAVNSPKKKVQELIEEYSHETHDRMNQIDLFCLRHFSKLRANYFPLSIRGYAKERTPVHNHELLDLFLELPPRLRACSRVYGDVLKSFSKQLAWLPYSRTGVSIMMPEIIENVGYILQPTIQEIQLWKREIFHENEEFHGETYDSYPKIDRLFQYSSMGLLANKVLSDGPIYDLGILERIEIMDLLNQERNGNIKIGEFLCNLMSLNQWLDSQS